MHLLSSIADKIIRLILKVAMADSCDVELGPTPPTYQVINLFLIDIFCFHILQKYEEFMACGCLVINISLLAVVYRYKLE